MRDISLTHPTLLHLIILIIYSERINNYEAPRHVIFTTLLLLPLS
jgi:hypothetical protein